MIESPVGTCELCGHTDFTVIFDREFRVLVCQDCGLVFLENAPRDYRKYYSDEYDYGLGADGRFVDNERDNESVFRWVLRHLPQTTGLTLLEIGCSAGFLLKRFKDCGIDVFGIEPNKRAVEFARRVNGIPEIECCMLEDAEAAARLYDVILLIQTLEHFADPLNCLRKVRGLLKEDGFLFIEVPNYYAPNGFYLHKCRGIDYPSPNHLFVYSRRTLSAFLRKARFSVYRTSFTLQDVRVVAMVDGGDERIEFDNYHRVMLHFHMLPMMTKAIDVLRFCKHSLLKLV